MASTGTLNLIIPVDEIPEAGRSIRGDLPAAWLGDSALPAYTPGGPVHVDVEVKRYQDNVHVEGTLRVLLRFTCGRTLEPGETELDVSFSELYQPATATSMNLGAGIDGLGDEDMDDSPHTYEDRKIDLEPLLREELVLAQEPYPTVPGAEDATGSGGESLAWTSAETPGDPRWAQLAQIKLSE